MMHAKSPPLQYGPIMQPGAAQLDCCEQSSADPVQVMQLPAVQVRIGSQSWLPVQDVRHRSFTHAKPSHSLEAPVWHERGPHWPAVHRLPAPQSASVEQLSLHIPL